MRKYIRNITVIKKHDKKRNKKYEQYVLTLPKDIANKLGKIVEIIDIERNVPLIIIIKRNKEIE